MKKRTAIAAVVTLAAVGGAVYLFMPKDDSSAIPEWNLGVVEATVITNSVTATGTVEPVTQVDVGTQVSGILTNLYVDYNSVVKEGQIIAELDKSLLNIELNASKNTVSKTKAEYTYQEANFKRTKALYEKELIAQSEYDLALYNYETAKSDYNNAVNTLEKAKINLGYATIYSPIDGVVLSKSVEEGQTVASSFSTPTLFNIAADLKDMEVIADVDEADIGGVKVNQRVTFTVDAFPLLTFEGYVKEVRQEGIVESNVVTYEVVISAANPDLTLKPGMTASVEIFTLEVDCMAAVPAAALTFTPPMPEGAEPMQQRRRPDGEMGERMERPDNAGRVFVKVGDMIEPRRVTVGASNGIHTEVEGVNAGDSVVLSLKSVPRSMKMSSNSKSPFVQQRPGPGPR
ncbi:MAG: efflux RND transporter periplasmic adaptor subunit [Rikenellaceae bacterium]